MIKKNRYKLRTISFILFVGAAILWGLQYEKRYSVKKINVLFSPFKSKEDLDPAVLRYTQEYTYLQNLTLNLVEVDGKGNYINQLAKAIKKNAEANELTITINEAYFSNGDKITIQDVVKSIKRAILKGTPHFKGKDIFVAGNKLTSIDGDIKGLEIIDDKTFIIRLNHSMKEIYYYLQLTDLSILHPDQYKKDALKVDDWKVTSGPYRIQLKEDGTAFLVANEKAFNYSEDMPQEIIFHKEKELEELKSKLDQGFYDVGVLSPKKYENLISPGGKFENYSLFPSNADGITTLALNIKNKKFSSIKTRQWLLKKVLANYKIENQEIYKKAFQFFLPEAKGYVQNAEVLKLLEDIDTNKIPSELTEGITIRAVTGMKNYVINDFEKTLSEILGIRVNIEFNVPWDEYGDFLNKREFEATIMSVSMSYKVLGETLNFQYLNNNPKFLDPSGKIKKYLGVYQSKENSNEEYEIIEDILKQMTLDAECVPLYYYSSPSFFREGKINVKDLFIDEAIQFWRIRAKG